MIRQTSVAELLRELDAVDESEDLEAKETSTEAIGRSVYETICALSNEPDLGGGTILLGVKKEMMLFPFYTAVGVAEPDRISSDLASGCGGIFNQPVRINIAPAKIGKATVLKVDVPELPRGSKPIYLKSLGLPKGAFRRIGPTDVRCTDEDLSVLYHGKSNDSYDARLQHDATWADLDPNSIAAYRKTRATANSLAEELNWSDEDMLFSLGAIKRPDGQLRITTTGLLTFGTASALRRLCPTHRVDYIRVPGKSWVQDPESRFDSLDMRGSIVTLVSRVIAAISDDLPKTLVVGDSLSGQRTETPVIPLRVIREAVVNALMHRNYQVHQPVQIIRYANRIVIKNPGYSLKSQDRFEDPGSFIRNPTIAEILHETRFAETKGSGIRVMNAKMNQSGLASPTFESDRDSDEFTATFLFHHFLDESDWEWLAQFKSFSLSEDQMKALIFVREVEAIDNATYRSLTHSDTLAASKSLRELRSLDLVADRGSGARTYYVPGPEMLKREGGRRLKVKRSATIHDKNTKMDGAIHDKPPVGFDDLPSHLKVGVRLTHLNKRLPPADISTLIERLCQWQPLSLAEIAGLLHRSPAYVSQKYVGPLISDGRLNYLYPEMIQHPGQRYKSTGVESSASVLRGRDKK
jgi:ATP-dependent DNA helicase RecG